MTVPQEGERYTETLMVKGRPCHFRDPYYNEFRKIPTISIEQAYGHSGMSSSRLGISTLIGLHCGMYAFL